MRKSLGFMTAILLFVVVSISFADEAKPQKNFLWKVTSDSTTVYLLGSIHLCKPELYPLDKAITKAYENAEFVVVEADKSPEKVAEIQMFAMQKAMYQDGTTLKDHLSEETYKKLKEHFEKRGISIDMMAQFKPALVAAQLAQVELMVLGFQPGAGIDEHFITLANKDKKPLKELESLKFQIELFSSLDDKIQEQSLIKELNETADLKVYMANLMKAWSFGDAKTMEQIIFEPLKTNPEMKSLYEKFFTERNVTMTAKIEEYLKSGKTHLVIAGSGHFIGKKGILALLGNKKDKPYKIEQVATLGRPVVEEIEEVLK